MRTAAWLTPLLVFTAAAGGPRVSPPFEIMRAGNAQPLKLSAYRGKIVALAFISTTCPHCQELTRELVSMAGQYQARGVQILECAINPTAKEDVPGFVAQFRPPFPVGYSDQFSVDTYLGRAHDDPHVFYVPHLVFIARGGWIQGDFAGESDFILHAADNTRVELDTLLKAEPPPVKSVSPAGASSSPSHP